MVKYLVNEKVYYYLSLNVKFTGEKGTFSNLNILFTRFLAQNINRKWPKTLLRIAVP